MRHANQSPVLVNVFLRARSYFGVSAFITTVRTRLARSRCGALSLRAFQSKFQQLRRPMIACRPPIIFIAEVREAVETSESYFRFLQVQLVLVRRPHASLTRHARVAFVRSRSMSAFETPGPSFLGRASFQTAVNQEVDLPGRSTSCG